MKFRENNKKNLGECCFILRFRYALNHIYDQKPWEQKDK